VRQKFHNNFYVYRLSDALTHAEALGSKLNFEIALTGDGVLYMITIISRKTNMATKSEPLMLKRTKAGMDSYMSSQVIQAQHPPATGLPKEASAAAAVVVLGRSQCYFGGGLYILMAG
jgi:hypothetical protein